MHPRTRLHEWTPISLEPLNGGPDPARLADSFLTSTSRFFVRNHGNVPLIDLDSWRLELVGEVRQPLCLSLDELRSRYSLVSRPVTIQCAGFRRNELIRVKPIPGELAWNDEPVATAEWGGIRLADLLEAAGPTDGARHVWFEGGDLVEREGRRFGFGGSVSLSEAEACDVILAFEMNGEALTAEHGWPLRAVVPNVIGARSVKWLTRIEVRGSESDNYFQERAYKLIDDVGAPPEIWRVAPALSQLPVNSVLCRPRSGERLRDGLVDVRGYAWGGGPGGIRSVDISTSAGAEWQPARLSDRILPGCWRHWAAQLELPVGRHHLAVRATGWDGECQPADPAAIWNAKGYLNNAWSRATIEIDPD